MRIMLKSKIEGIKVTGIAPSYPGSIAIDPEVMREANIMEYEQVHVLNISNGERFVTNALEGEKGNICVNGAATKLVSIGDNLIILAYGIYEFARDRYVSYSKPRIITRDYSPTTVEAID